MSRIRTIKPSFWTSAQIMDCRPVARLFFIGLWNFCDDEGRHPVNEKQLRALIFPGDDLTLDAIRAMVDELARNDLIRLYHVDGREYLEICGWNHQKIDKRQPPKFPSPKPIDDHSPPFDERSGNGIDGKDRKGREGKEVSSREDGTEGSETDVTAREAKTRPFVVIGGRL